MMQTPASHRFGFTLLELSIVLVIIALITGAITFGQDIIRGSERQSIIADYDRYKKAVRLFYDKYQSMPGDMSNATSIWGADSNCPNTAANSEPKTATCNGNGDTLITDGTSTVTTYSVTNGYEALRAWQHLANAKFLEGTYAGVAAADGLRPGTNVPQTTIKSNSFTVHYAKPGNSTGIYNANYRHIVTYGKAVGVAGSGPMLEAGILAADALYVDQKIDDGYPGKGSVLSLTTASSVTPNCATSATESSAEYRLSNGDPICSLIFITGY